ncbi:hypothetical protein BGLA2_780050 [Burkholderia gladioli]|nr:hypothetical protein BGLA2_780050 [Burkholderia gladioli]
MTVPCQIICDELMRVTPTKNSHIGGTSSIIRCIRPLRFKDQPMEFRYAITSKIRALSLRHAHGTAGRARRLWMPETAR